MFMARRDAKCWMERRRRAGQTAFAQRQTTSSSGRTSGLPQDGHAAGITHGWLSAGRLLRTGATTFGMTSPPFSMMTVVAGPDVAPLDLLLVVQRGLADGRSRQADRLEHGVRRDRPGASDLHFDAPQEGRGLLGRELEGDRPARELGGRAEPCARRVQIVELDDDPVGIELELVPGLAPLAAVLDHGVNAVARVANAARPAIPTRASSSAFRPGWPAPRPEAGSAGRRMRRARASTPSAGSSVRIVPAATLRGLANTGSPASSRSRLMRSKARRGRYTSPRTSTLPRGPSFSECGIDLMVRTLVVTSSPRVPSPRVTPRSSRPFS